MLNRIALAAIVLALSAPLATAQGTDAKVTFTETTSGGGLVIVPEVVLPSAGFVAIHDSTLLSAEDPFGSVIGVSKPLPAGTHRNVAVELGPVPGNDKDFTTGDNDTLIAMPHKDSNGNGVYDFITSGGAQDGPFDGPNATPTFAGNIVLAAAKVTRSSVVVATDQTTNGATFKAAFVDLPVAGFLAMHDKSLLDNEDPFGSVVGVSPPLSAGLHKDVVVTFGKNAPGATKTGALASSQLLILMPHKDSNTNGVYDFIKSSGAQDGPFSGMTQTFAGKIDVATATLTVSNPYGASTTATSATKATATTPAPAPGSSTSKGMPGLEAVAVLAGLGAAAFLMRRT